MIHNEQIEEALLHIMRYGRCPICGAARKTKVLPPVYDGDHVTVTVVLTCPIDHRQ